MALMSHGLEVIKELNSLIKELQDSMSHVPGSDRLIRACTKELHHFTELPFSQLDKAASCSNLPHFRAIIRLAQSYGNRVTGMLCRFRMPSNKYQSTCDSFQTSDNDLNFRRRKPESVLVDLVCVQQSRELDNRSRNLGLPDQQHCPGNASDADSWAPSLWIKVVTRDAARLNAVWLGEASSSRATCLHRQMEELVRTATWYQRGQPVNWIRPVIHWLPNTGSDISALDKDLLSALTQLNVCFLPNCHPWSSSSAPSVPQQFDTLALDMMRTMHTLSLRKHIANPYCIQRALRMAYKRPIDMDGRLASVTELEMALRNAFTNISPEEITDDTKWDVDQVNSIVLDATLQLAIRPPFSKEIFDNLDSYPRVNLDVSAMIALVSELSQFLPNRYEPKSGHEVDSSAVLTALESDSRRECLLQAPKFTCNTLGWLLESEAERPVLPVIHQHVCGSIILACRTAALSFLRILITVAGKHEWFRGLYLLSQLVLVPDLVFDNSPSALASKQGNTAPQNNRKKTQLIMDVGNAFGALTITSNEAFLRSLRTKGLKHAALLVPARALTETAARDE